MDLQGGLRGNPQVNPQVIPQGLMPGNAPIVSSGMGDIILDPGAGSGGKSRKWIVVVLIVVIVLAALVGGGVAMWKNSGEGGGIEQEKNTLRSAFNRFSNYIYLGEAVDIDFYLRSNWRSASELKFMLDDGADIDGDEKTSFFNTAKEYGDAFYTLLNSTIPNDNTSSNSTEYVLWNLGNHIHNSFERIYQIGIDSEIDSASDINDILSYYNDENTKTELSSDLSAELLLRLDSFKNKMEAWK